MLKKRRKKSQKALLIVLGIALLLLLIGFMVVAWQPMFRVIVVSSLGAACRGSGQIALATLTGTHAFVLAELALPHPRREVRSRILAAYPDIEAVSIASDGLNALRHYTPARGSVRVVRRRAGRGRRYVL